LRTFIASFRSKIPRIGERRESEPSSDPHYQIASLVCRVIKDSVTGALFDEPCFFERARVMPEKQADNLQRIAPLFILL